MASSDSTPKHTPGPWGIEQTRYTNWIGPLRPDGKPDPVLIGIDRNGYKTEIIGVIDANARLIAAAPDLLAALKELLEDPDYQIAIGGNPNAVDAMLARARAAIARAEGR